MVSKAKNHPRRPISSEYTTKPKIHKNYNHYPTTADKTTTDNSLSRVPTPFPHYPQLDSFVPKQ